MAISRFRLLSALTAFAVTAASFLSNAVAAAAGFVRSAFLGLADFDARPIRDLFNGPALSLEGVGGTGIDPSLLHSQRHEAGVARMGAVRHT